MKKLILLLAVLFTGICNAQFIKEVDDFSKIKIDANAQIEIVHSTKTQVVFSKKEQDLKGLVVTSENNALRITDTSINTLKDLRIRIYTNDVEALSVDGNSKIVFNNFSYQDSMVIMATSGATVNTGDMIIKNLKIVRSSGSEVVCKNAKNTKESIDGVMVAMN